MVGQVERWTSSLQNSRAGSISFFHTHTCNHCVFRRSVVNSSLKVSIFFLCWRPYLIWTQTSLSAPQLQVSSCQHICKGIKWAGASYLSTLHFNTSFASLPDARAELYGKRPSFHCKNSIIHPPTVFLQEASTNVVDTPLLCLHPRAQLGRLAH